jgi:hypothetical protein
MAYDYIRQQATVVFDSQRINRVDVDIRTEQEIKSAFKKKWINQYHYDFYFKIKDNATFTRAQADKMKEISNAIASKEGLQRDSRDDLWDMTVSNKEVKTETKMSSEYDTNNLIYLISKANSVELSTAASQLDEILASPEKLFEIIESFYAMKTIALGKY